MTCEACDLAARKVSHLFHAGCRGCAARALSRSPHFHRVRDAGRLDRAYRSALEQFGLTHLEVREAAANDFESRHEA